MRGRFDPNPMKSRPDLRKRQSESAAPRTTAQRTTARRATAGAAAPSAPEPAPKAAGARYSRREGHLLLVDDATSVRMGQVRQKGTRPELAVRGALAALGHRFRLDGRRLEGSPDIVNLSRRWVVFVHGCFWHRHGCRATTTPTRNREFWEAKFARNVARDQRSVQALEARGFTVIVVWECETKRDPDALRAKLAEALRRRG